jgi:hypothetical protein
MHDPNDARLTPEPAYPVGLSIDYPERDLDRVSTLFRIFLAIPSAIVLGLLSSGTIGGEAEGEVTYRVAAPGILALPVLLMLLFRQKYPRWWFDWNVGLTAFSYRVAAYMALMRDEYPATDDEQSVHLRIPYPDAQRELNRWLPLVKWFLAIPHYVVLAFLVLAAIIAVLIAWFAILFTGRYPRSLFDFVVGVMRWSLRVGGYVALLVTDHYPPFRLAE